MNCMVLRHIESSELGGCNNEVAAFIETDY